VDITQRKEQELERQRVQARALEAQRLESLGTFAGGVAHELNNILTIMLGCAELVRRDALRPDQTARVLSHADEIQNAGARAKQLLHQVLAFGRRPSGEKQVLALCTVVEQALTLMRGTLTRELTLETRLDPAAPAILGDPAQLQQVLILLCTNAAQAMRGRHGALRIGVQPGGPTGAQASRAEYACLTVSDDGVGISEHDQGRIFEPFFTTRELGQGAGLGLSLVDSLVRAHAGTIHVASKVGEGTTFTLYFPRASKL
jgi:signal transduction histidine kinase